MRDLGLPQAYIKAWCTRPKAAGYAHRAAVRSFDSLTRKTAFFEHKVGEFPGVAEIQPQCPL